MSDGDLYLTFDPKYPINSDVHLTSDPLFLYVFILQIPKKRSVKAGILNKFNTNE